MNPRLIQAGLIALAGAFVLLGMADKLPHEWFGITTATLLGLAITYADRIVGLVLVIIILDRQRQLNRKMSWIVWRLGAPREGHVVQGPWGRRSG